MNRQEFMDTARHTAGESYYLFFVAVTGLFFLLVFGQKVLQAFLVLILLSILVLRWDEIDQTVKLITGKVR